MLRRQASFSTTTGRLNMSCSPRSSRNGDAPPPRFAAPRAGLSMGPEDPLAPLPAAAHPVEPRRLLQPPRLAHGPVLDALDLRPAETSRLDRGTRLEEIRGT